MHSFDACRKRLPEHKSAVIASKFGVQPQRKNDSEPAFSSDETKEECRSAMKARGQSEGAAYQGTVELFLKPREGGRGRRTQQCPGWPLASEEERESATVDRRVPLGQRVDEEHRRDRLDHRLSFSRKVRHGVCRPLSNEIFQGCVL